MEKINLKKEILKIIGGILYIIAIGYAINYFHFGFIGTYLIILFSSIVLMFVSKTLKLKSLFTTAITLVLIMLLLRYLGNFGGFFLSTALICGIILIGRRKRFIKVKQQCESMLWGKPLKEYIDANEKPPKLKIKF